MASGTDKPGTPPDRVGDITLRDMRRDRHKAAKGAFHGGPHERANALRYFTNGIWDLLDLLPPDLVLMLEQHGRTMIQQPDLADREATFRAVLESWRRYLDDHAPEVKSRSA